MWSIQAVDSWRSGQWPVGERTFHAHQHRNGHAVVPALVTSKQAKNRDRMEWSEDAAYELKAGDFTLKSRPMRRPISQAVRSAALSIAALGCIARACVLIWPERPRSTVTAQRN